MLLLAFGAFFEPQRPENRGWIWREGAPVVSQGSKPTAVDTTAECRSMTSDTRYFGVGLAAVGDTNADGMPDFLVADVLPRQAEGCTWHPGAVWILSGRDSSVLTFIQTGTAHVRFGCSAAGLGDVDMDGGADWIIGAADVHAVGNGFAEVYSGKSGRRLFRFEGPHDFGGSVGAAGDFDGDGRPDAVVSGDPDARAPRGDVLARVYSGHDGRVLCTVGRSSSSELLVANPVGVGDLDGDGRSELALLMRAPNGRALELRVLSGQTQSVSRSFPISLLDDPYVPYLDHYTLSSYVSGTGSSEPLLLVGTATGAARLISLVDGRTIVKHSAEERYFLNIEFGAGMAVAGDLDEDGTPDLWVGQDAVGIVEGVVFAHSGRDDHVIYALGCGSSNVVNLDAWHFGTSIVAIGDVDGDGVSEALVGTNHMLSHQPGCAFVFSGKTGRRLIGLSRRGSDVVVTR